MNDELEVMDITEDGAEMARQAMAMYTEGYTPEEIFDALDMPPIDDLELTKEQSIGMLMIIARSAGVFDA